LITPLDWLAVGWPGWGSMRLVRCCPICGGGFPPVFGSIACDFEHVVYGDAENAERDEDRWEFQPCGCVGREIVEAAG